jgi:hypothetical protein
VTTQELMAGREIEHCPCHILEVPGEYPDGQLLSKSVIPSLFLLLAKESTFRRTWLVLISLSHLNNREKCDEA